MGGVPDTSINLASQLHFLCFAQLFMPCELLTVRFLWFILGEVSPDSESEVN